jgi:WD40 repeat protein
MHTRTPGFEPIQIEFSPDGASLAVMSMGSYLPCDAWGGNFALYRLQDQRLLYSRNFCPQASLFYFRFGTNGKVYFVSNIVDSDPGAEVSVVDAATGQLLDRVPYDFESAVYDVSFDGSRYAVRAFQDGDEFTRIVEAGTNRILETIPGDVVFLPDPDKLLVDRGEGPWEVIEDGSPICGFNDATIPFLLVDAHKSASDLGSEGRFLIQQDAWGGGVQIWDLANCTLSAVIPFPGGDLNPTFSPDGRLLGIDDSSGIGIWDTGTGRFLYVLPRDTVWSSWPSFLFSPDGSCIATYPNEDDLVLWNAEDGRRLRTISLGVHPVDITFGPTCSRLAVTDRAGLSLLDLDSGSPQARQIPIPGEPGSLFWSPDGATIAIETPADAQLAFYDGESGGLLRRIDLGEAAGVAAFSPDWRTFATTADGYLFLWDSTQGIMLRRFSGHHVIGDDSSRTWELSFSANGKMLVSLGSYDDTLRFWDLKSGLLAGELITPFHTRRIALSPDGRLLATSGDDGTIRIWGVRP